MKQHFFIILIIFFLMCTRVHAQKGVEYYKKVYVQAKRYSDVSLATIALHHLILLGNTTYKDTLASVYTNNGLYASGYLLSKELLVQRPNNTQLLIYLFDNAANLGYVQEAITAIDALLLKEPTNSVYHYQKADFLTKTTDISSALQAINKGLAIPIIQKQIMVDGIKGNRIAVPIHSKLYHLKGLVYFQLKDKVAAKEAFTKALQLAPEYKNVINNLKALESNKTK